MVELKIFAFLNMMNLIVNIIFGFLESCYSYDIHIGVLSSLILLVVHILIYQYSLLVMYVIYFLNIMDVFHDVFLI